MKRRWKRNDKKNEKSNENGLQKLIDLGPPLNSGDGIQEVTVKRRNYGFYGFNSLENKKDPVSNHFRADGRPMVSDKAWQQ